MPSATAVARQTGDDRGLRRGQRAHDADADAGHDARRLAAGEQGDLRVPRLHRQGRFELEGVGAVALLHHLLLRRRDAHAAPLPLAVEQVQADLAEEGERRERDTRLQRTLDLGVRARGATPHRGPDAPGRGGVRPGIQVEGPEQRRAVDPGQEAGHTFAEFVGVERRPAVGQVQRDAACERLAVERAAGGDEGGHVGDRVAHAVAGAGAFGVERLIEVARCRAGRSSPRSRSRASSSRSRRLPVAAGGRRAPHARASAITSASKRGRHLELVTGSGRSLVGTARLPERGQPQRGIGQRASGRRRTLDARCCPRSSGSCASRNASTSVGRRRPR